jgi:hypothetical protein
MLRMSLHCWPPHLENKNANLPNNKNNFFLPTMREFHVLFYFFFASSDPSMLGLSLAEQIAQLEEAAPVGTHDFMSNSIPLSYG